MTEATTASGRTTAVALLAIGTVLLVAFAVPVLRFLLLPIAVGAVLVVAYLRKHWLAVVLSAAFLARLLALAIDTQVGFVVVTGTSMENHQAFAAFADGLVRGDPFIPPNDRRVILGVLYLPFYLVLGNQYVVGAIATAFYGSLLGVPIYYIIRQFGDRRAALAGSGAVIFWPSVLFRSLVVQRETIIVLCLFIFVYVSMRWVTRIQARHLLLVLPTLWVIFQLRSENVLFVAILGGLVILARGRLDTVTITLLTVGTAVGLFFVLNFGQLTNFGSTVSVTAIDNFAHGRSHGRAAYLEHVHYRTWLDIVVLAPVKLVYFLFSPLPWRIEQPVDLFAGLSGWGVFLCCLLIPRAFRQYPDYRRELFVLVGYALIGATLYGLIEMNYGAAFRRRIAFVAIPVMLAACVVSRVRFTLDGQHTETQTTTESV